MALDIRLDFISNIKPIALEEMSELRKKFIEVDDLLKAIADAIDALRLPAGQRTIALARTNLEIALQFSIKSLCIMGEQD